MKTTSDAGRKSTKGNGSGNPNNMMPAGCEAAGAAPSGNAEMIAVAAYFRAEQRGFAPGNELDDWVQAEAEYGAGTTPNTA